MSVAIANPSVASSPALVDGDDMFTNVNMKLERSLLPPGTLALSVNKRLRFGSADTRNGCRCLINLSNPIIQSGVAIDRRVTNSFTASLLLGMRNDYDGGSLAIPIFDPNTGALTTSISQSAGPPFQIRNFLIFPAFGKTLVVSGYNGTVGDPDLPWQLYEWNGTSGVFAATANSTPGDTSTTRADSTWEAAVMENRLVFRLNRYTVAWTLVGDYTRYDPIYGIANTQRDVGGDITCLFPTLQKTLLVFKTQSILALVNFTGNLGSSTVPPPFSIQEINPHIGCTAPRSVVQVGADVFFLSANAKGIYRLSMVLQDRLAVLSDPVTLPLQPLIDRINWPYAGMVPVAPSDTIVKGGACAATIGEYVFFAVPIDGSTVNNCVIVFNAATNQLEGYDTFGASISIDRLFVLSANGVPQLYAVDHVNGRVFLMYDETLTGASRHDVFPSGNVAIADTMETRGYATQGLEGAQTRRKKFKRLRVALATQSPSVTLTAVSDGVNEQRTLTPAPITKSATKNYVFGAAGTNPGAAYQEDYANGATQELIVRRSLEISGRSLSIRIANTQGTCNVRSVGVEARPLPKMAEAGA